VNSELDAANDMEEDIEEHREKGTLKGRVPTSHSQLIIQRSIFKLGLGYIMD
jgi:hypothetical protein